MGGWTKGEGMNVIPTLPTAELRGYTGRAEQRVLLHDVRWDAYVAFREALRDRGAIRMTYDRGLLEIMTTSHEHEKLKKRLGRLIETLAEEHGLRIESAGQMTFQREDLARAFEGDDCFWIAHEAQVRGRREWDPTRDPPPDLLLEIEISRSALPRLALYAAFGVPEVWRFDGETIRVHLLQPDGTYRSAERSPTFPTIPLDEVARVALPDPNQDFLSAVGAFREWVREHLPRQRRPRTRGSKRRKGRSS
jgi:Uma2 family endonuclease